MFEKLLPWGLFLFASVVAVIGYVMDVSGKENNIAIAASHLLYVEAIIIALIATTLGILEGLPTTL